MAASTESMACCCASLGGGDDCVFASARVSSVMREPNHAYGGGCSPEWNCFTIAGEAEAPVQAPVQHLPSSEYAANSVVIKERGPEPVVEVGEQPGPNSSAMYTEYSVTLNRTDCSQPVGLVVTTCLGGTLMVSKVSPGLISERNKTCPTCCQVQPGDVICEINGVHGDATSLLEKFGEDTVLNMILVRPT